MIREWADQDTHDMIEEALLPPARMLAATWDDDDAWSTFETAMRAESG